MSILDSPEGIIDEKGRCFYFNPEGVLGLTLPINGQPATISNGMTIGFKVPSIGVGNRWHAASLANGGTTCEEPPGVRVGPTKTLYLAYLRDPSGNKMSDSFSSLFYILPRKCFYYLQLRLSNIYSGNQ